jgi:hypothetical protein
MIRLLYSKMNPFKFFAVALGVVLLAEVAPRLLVNSDLERFVTIEGPAVQYAGMAQSLLHRQECAGSLAILTCTGVRIVEVRLVNPGVGAGISVPSGCLFPYEGTAQVYSLFGIPTNTVKIDCNLGFSRARN